MSTPNRKDKWVLEEEYKVRRCVSLSDGNQEELVRMLMNLILANRIRAVRNLIPLGETTFEDPDPKAKIVSDVRNTMIRSFNKKREASCQRAKKIMIQMYGAVFNVNDGLKIQKPRFRKMSPKRKLKLEQSLKESL